MEQKIVNLSMSTMIHKQRRYVMGLAKILSIFVEKFFNVIASMDVLISMFQNTALQHVNSKNKQDDHRNRNLLHGMDENLE